MSPASRRRDLKKGKKTAQEEAAGVDSFCLVDLDTLSKYFYVSPHIFSYYKTFVCMPGEFIL